MAPVRAAVLLVCSRSTHEGSVPERGLEVGRAHAGGRRDHPDERLDATPLLSLLCRLLPPSVDAPQNS